MSVMRWEPLRELTAAQQQMRRMLEQVFGPAGGEQEQGERRWLPAIDVVERGDELLLRFDLPGIPKDQINVEVEDGTLTVTAERERSHEVSNERFYRFERRFGTFTRTIGLPQGVNDENIRAEFRDGVLEIHVPKPEQAKPRRIQVGGTSEQRTIEGSAKKQ